MERMFEYIKREAECWPGVRLEVKPGGRHPKAVFTYAGNSRFTTFTTTRTDRRGMLNKIRDVRLVLTALGASRKD